MPLYKILIRKLDNMIEWPKEPVLNYIFYNSQLFEFRIRAISLHHNLILVINQSLYFFFPLPQIRIYPLNQHQSHSTEFHFPAI